MMSSTAITWLLRAAFAPFIAWWGTWAVLAVRAALPVRRRPDPVPKRFDVVIPAHDEGARVGGLVQSLLEQEGPSSLRRILVVADHCHDDTAEVAAAAGAEVLVRDSGAAGKPPALRAGVELLRQDPERADGVIFIDGDCVVNRGFATALAERLRPGVEVVQAAYTLLEPATDAVRSNLRVAFALRNVVRATGADALGLPVVLSGSGMLFSWDALDHLSFGDPRLEGTGDTRPVADDVLMALDLVAAGVHPAFARGAEVEAPTPDDEQSLGAQRLRWEGGQALMWREIPRVARRAIGRGDWRALLGLVEWTAPPLVATAATAGAVSGVVVVVVVAGAGPANLLVLPAVAAAGLGTYLAVGVGILEGPGEVAAMATRMPRFVGWKLRLYAAHRTARRPAAAKRT